MENEVKKLILCKLCSLLSPAQKKEPVDAGSQKTNTPLRFLQINTQKITGLRIYNPHLAASLPPAAVGYHTIPYSQIPFQSATPEINRVYPYKSRRIIGWIDPYQLKFSQSLVLFCSYVAFNGHTVVADNGSRLAERDQ